MQMSFRVGQQVWAKVQPFPWWPAKILNMYLQPPQEQLVFKVRFFNDPTFAYLTEDCLVEYQSGRGRETQMRRDCRLERAVQMADQVLARRKRNWRGKDGRGDEISAVDGGSLEEEPSPAPTHVITPIISNQKQQPLPSHSPTPPFTANTTHHESIVHEGAPPIPLSFPLEQSLPVLEPTVDNILQLLSVRRQQEPSQYNYENRKKTIQRQAELKQKLLERYRLHDLTQQEEVNERGDNDGKGRERGRKKEGWRSRIIRKKVTTHSLQNMRERCIKKLYSIARKSFSHDDSMKRTCLQLITRLTQISQENPLRFKSLYLALIRSIQAPFSQIQTTFTDKIGAFRGCLERFEDKGQDEEGSKMTQVSAQQ